MNLIPELITARFGKAVEKCVPTQTARAAHILCQFPSLFTPASSSIQTSQSSTPGSGSDPLTTENKPSSTKT